MLIDHTNQGDRMHQPVRARARTAIALAALSAALATAAPAIVASPAAAEQWMHVSCINPDQSAAPSDGWSGGSFPIVSVGSTNNTNCTATAPMYATLSANGPANTDSSEYIAYTPPTGSTLVGGSLLVGMQANGYGYQAYASAAIFTPAYDPSFQHDGNVVLQCSPLGIYTCGNGVAEFYGVVNLPANLGGNLYLGAGCTRHMRAPSTCSAGGSRGVWSSVALASANLLLSTTSQPTADAFAGSLLTAGAHGNATLTFTASDTGPGIYRANVTVDGAAVYTGTPNTNAGRCVPVGTDPGSGALMFDWQQPCPRSQSVVIPVDSTKLADGEHALKVTLQNAAGNVSTVLAQTITTNNLTTISGKLSSDAPAPPPRTRARVRDRSRRADPSARARRATRIRELGAHALRDAAQQRRHPRTRRPGHPQRSERRPGRPGRAGALEQRPVGALGAQGARRPDTPADDHLRLRSQGRRHDQTDRPARTHAHRPSARPCTPALQRAPAHRAARLAAAVRRYSGAQGQRLAERRAQRARQRLGRVHARLPGPPRNGPQGREHRRQLRISRCRAHNPALRHRGLTDQKGGRPLMLTPRPRSRSRAAAGFVLAALLLTGTPAIAGAASPPVTRQAQTANAAFLAYAPAPPAGPKALCLVDSGVNPVPDLTAGLVSATALDGGTGNDTDPLTHGTIDAAVAGGAGATASSAPGRS